MFQTFLASLNELVDCGEKPDGSRGAEMPLTLKHVEQVVNLGEEQRVQVIRDEYTHPQTRKQWGRGDAVTPVRSPYK